MTKKRKKGEAPSAWDNLVMRWDTPPELVRLKTDSQVQINWPFGDDLAEVMSTLNDKYFSVFLKKARALCEEEAKRRPQGERARFLEEQRRRLEGYVAARRGGAGS